MPRPRREIDDDTTLAWDRSHTSFTQIPDWILTNRTINDGALRTWLAIASFADNQSRGAFPKVKTLAEMRGKGRSQIFDHLQQLEQAGLIVRTAQYYDDGRRRNNHYVLAWGRPFEAQPLDDEDPRPENRTTPDPTDEARPENRTADADRPENRAGARPENRATRTRPTKELDPPTPQQKHHLESSEPRQGATAPRTPRSSKRHNGRRADGMNPRAQREAEDNRIQRTTAMKNWARTMNIPGLSFEDFEETVQIEIRSGKVTSEDAEIALTEARILHGVSAQTPTE